MLLQMFPPTGNHQNIPYEPWIFFFFFSFNLEQPYTNNMSPGNCLLSPLFAVSCKTAGFGFLLKLVLLLDLQNDRTLTRQGPGRPDKHLRASVGK